MYENFDNAYEAQDQYHCPIRSYRPLWEETGLRM